MKTAVSVTLAGNFAIGGSCLSLTAGALFGLKYLCLLENTNSEQSTKLTFFIIALVLISMSFWCSASGVGVVRLRRWARISILILACLLVLFGLPAISTMRMPPPTNWSVATFHWMRNGTSIFSLFLANIGIWWLILFNRSSVKKIFQVSARMDSQPKMSVGVLTIGWCMIFSALFWIPTGLL